MNSLYIFDKKEYRILFLILLVNILIPKISSGQDFWEQIDFPYGTSIFSITVDDQSKIYIGGGDGVYSSSNLGVDWEYHGINRTIYSIASDNNIVYAGNSLYEFASCFWRTLDGGNTWDTIMSDMGVYGNVVAVLPLGDTIFASAWADLGPNLLFTDDYDSGWVNLLDLENHEGEYVSDIIVNDSGHIYVSLMTYHPDRGGVLKSEDFGNNWEFTGLLNHMVTSLGVNNNNDVFAGVWGGEQGAIPGLYVLRNEENEWVELIGGPQVDDLVINSEGHIYFSSSWPNGILRSVDNGETFELVNEGLPTGPMGYLTIDNQGFLYVTSHYGSNFLAKSINPTVSVSETKYLPNIQSIIIYPNPVDNFINIKCLSTIDHAQTFKIVITNSIGQLVQVSKNHKSLNQIQIKVKDLISGLYFLNISSEKYSTTIKFIKN